METKEEKTGTIQEFIEDAKNCGFHPTEELPLEVRLTRARLQIDEAFQKILTDSKLPLSVFDYVVTSVLADIRKADADTIRLSNYHEMEE